VIDDVIARWHRYLDGELPGGLDELLADDVVFYSPVVFTPQRGKEVTSRYLAAASRALGGGEEGAFRYTKEVLAGDTAVLRRGHVRQRRRHHHRRRLRPDRGVPRHDPAAAGHPGRARADGPAPVRRLMVRPPR
jgi:hypothetical protein